MRPLSGNLTGSVKLPSAAHSAEPIGTGYASGAVNSSATVRPAADEPSAKRRKPVTSTSRSPRTSSGADSVRPVVEYLPAAMRSASSCEYSVSPGQLVLLPSRCPEMRWNVTGVPVGYRLVSPPSESTTTVPLVGTPCTDSFQPISRASASMPAGVCATDVNVPRQATPVELLFHPCACAPT